MVTVFSKYIIIGALNTGVTLAVIFILTYCGMGVYYANILGYAAGIGFSFMANSVYTFQTSIKSARLVKFLSVCAVSYGVNLAVLYVALSNFPSHIYSAQFSGMAAYTLVGFILNKKWAMK